MYSQSHLLHKQAWAGRCGGLFALWLALLIFALTTSAASAQTVRHVTNPYAGSINYLNPDYTSEINSAIAAQPAGSTLAGQMAVLATYPTAVWLDKIGAIYGGPAAGGRLSLQQHINAALQQQADLTRNPSGLPIVVELVIYDLPQRDCAALASNGELSIAGGDTVIGPNGTPITLTGSGLQEYETDYIAPIFNTLQMVAGNPNIRFVLVVEDDSLPNMITNVGQSPNPAIAACVAANAGVTGAPSPNGVYVQAIQFALNQFHQLPNAYNYLDVGHHGWLGWSNNFQPGVNFLTSVAKGTTAGLASVDGFITNTANYGPTVEPLMTSDEMIGGQPVHAATFYHFNPFIDEQSYAAALDAAFIQAGFPSTLGFLIDTSRNGWGGPTRPTAASTSTVLDTFVNATKIDGRTDMGQWCNQPNAGLGAPPAANPGGFANLSAYVWIKPPGESDGNYPGSVFNGVTSTVGDPNCNPTHSNSLANNQTTNAVPNSPRAGTFWIPYFTMLVQNAFPAVGSGNGGPPPTVTLTPTATTVKVTAGSTATDTITVAGATSAVTLSAAGQAAGVTVTFAPSSTTSTSVMTLSAAKTAAAGTFTLTITGTFTDSSGPHTASTTVAVTVGTGTTGVGTCHVGYTIANQWNPGFQVGLSIDNTGTTAISGWTLAWTFANGQTVTQLWNGTVTQSGANVTVKDAGYNANIPAGGSYKDAGFVGTWNNATNAVPTGFTLNGAACTVN